MDLFDLLLNAGLITAALVAYLIFFKKSSNKCGEYREPGWNYPLKYLFARVFVVKRWKAQMKPRPLSELPRTNQYEGWDDVSVRAASTEGAAVLLDIRKLCGHQPLAEVTVHIRLADGTNYKLPRHPDTAVGAWVSIPDGWSAGGLKIQVLEPESRLRILYNGLLADDDGIARHAKLNLTWASASDVYRYPEDWSDQLAAEALALEPWRDGDWAKLLEKWKEGSWSQWGAVQGRLQLFTADGAPHRSEYLRARGVRERRWAPLAASLRRSVLLTATASDGTAVQLRALSYKNVITQCISGSVRFPNTAVTSIIGTNLHLPDFCEIPGAIPKVFTIDVETQGRSLRLVVRPSGDEGRLLSGVPYQHEVLYRAVAVDIDGYPGAGVLELGYLPSVASEPLVSLSPQPVLRWLTEDEAGSVGYCVQLESKAAACPNLVGGKGASLALLASVQSAEGYRVPPGFCLTIRALEKHFEVNPHLMQAVLDIEAANVQYDETNFKEKCAIAADLFTNTEITDDVRADILIHLNELRKKATKEDLGPERRFAVRSSAVGEDSETLSAAGQNETILGCISDSDVIKGVQKCWASMFAFTSAYYRRQNGQPCVCGGGVVVQALVPPRAAGVMFTRDPGGDPSRLLITANYGLGESVVSGAVEPDTIVVSRSQDGRLDISKIELGSKTKRVTTNEDGVLTEDVPEAERKVPCISEGEVIRLAQIGVAQEELWGAGRDIEWAISKNEIFLVQARPITSLERWTDEELLHELDTAVMADDELTTLANVGEVFPKPVTPLSHDLVLMPLAKGIDKTVSNDTGNYENSLILSHNRCIIASYNNVYRRVPPKVNVSIRMIEMAIHGHKVADDEVIRTAVHRRPPSWTDNIVMISFLLKSILTSKWCMKDTIKKVNEMKLNTDTEDSLEILESLTSTKELIWRIAMNHTTTSGASTSSQFIAMSVFLEGGSEFSPEQCNEICELLNCGDVLSAEVPLGLAKLARKIEESGMAEQFRKLDANDAMVWLQKNLPHIYLDVTVFLEQHGHRAIMEFDMYTKPWVLVPEELMKILQTLRHSKQEATVSKTDADVIKSLTTKKSSTRKVLAWVLPLCRRTVRHREGTKAHLILGVHKLRLAAIELGKRLVRQWYLPHHDLVFFFRAAELNKYIQTRDPALLRKAIQRHQSYPGWCKLKFAELNTGWVQPLAGAGAEARAAAGGARVEAMSVCGGEAVARACVVTDLSEINQLKQGDILITYATDIGWSPYFPLLSGIVTELGGLISHGAVIAREYGIPCIVGATHATELFKTGDTVRLIGAKGVIERVEVDKTEANDDSCHNACI